MYEGGPSIVADRATRNGSHGQEETDKAIAFNKDPAIEKPVMDILQAYYDIVTTNDSNDSPGDPVMVFQT